MRATQLTQEQANAAALLTLREAKVKYGISQGTWQRLRREGTFISNAQRAAEDAEAVVAGVLASVREAPHLSTAARAKALGLRIERTQGILATRGLSRLNERLRFAGYHVEAVKPLQVARLRRIVAIRPGALTHIDYKTFGFVRGMQAREGQRLGGYVVVDSFTGWITVHLAPTTGPRPAIAAVEKHLAACPFECTGVLFSDNGPTDFTVPDFVRFAHEKGFLQRTTRVRSPWSNGKVEAVNRTLKYQCFPVIANSPTTSWEDVAKATDLWVKYYNDQRAHTGHCNRGLPPRVLYELWSRTAGDHLERLVALGIVPSEATWHIRGMGSDATGHGGLRDRHGREVALVAERRGTAYVPLENQNWSPLKERTFAPADRPSNIVLAR